MNYKRFNDDFEVTYRVNDDLGRPKVTLDQVFKATLIQRLQHGTAA